MVDATVPGTVLVVLPTLGKRIDKLRASLAAIAVQRDEVEVELVVVAPADATEARALALEWGARVIDDPMQGISHANNLGLMAANGCDYYAWMGDDDLFRPGGLATLRALLEGSPDAVLAFGGCDYITDTDGIVATSRAGRWARPLQPWGPNLIPHPGTLFRMDAVTAAGLYDESLGYAMDLDLYLRLRKSGHFVHTNESVSAFRWHPDSLTVANRTASSLEAELVKARYLPRAARPFRKLWEVPLRVAAMQAARQLSRRARAHVVQ